MKNKEKVDLKALTDLFSDTERMQSNMSDELLQIESTTAIAQVANNSMQAILAERDREEADTVEKAGIEFFAKLDELEKE